MELPWHVDLLQGLPRRTVSMDVHGKAMTCSGVDLVDILRHAGAMPADPLRGTDLARHVEVRARDGYTVVFSLGELDPTLGKQRVYVTDQCDGKPLPADAGPARLLIPGDTRPARSARQVQTFIIE
ncbi:molybdopterin-dependent oxidoreductase [Pseudoxanthomonas japonensis]|uniref:molybdopterin-dependent oxidoreductase n=1 Tax=Pseudoxanthomonas japonensis TaxID=69284 RepID=UPI001BCDE0CD|nr:molybdopterin-dependent oxidoreductase [Pseudoxanthomonas japonensis]